MYLLTLRLVLSAFLFNLIVIFAQIPSQLTALNNFFVIASGYELRLNMDKQEMLESAQQAADI